MKSTIACSVMMAALGAAGCAGRAQKFTVETALQWQLRSPSLQARADPEAWAAVVSAYRINDGRPLWLDDAQPRPELAELRAALRASAADGLDPTRYAQIEIAPPALAGSGLFGARYPASRAAAYDVRVTFAAARYARDLHAGRVAADDVDPHWFGTGSRLDLGAVLYRAARSGEVEATLRRAAPRHAQYARLRAALRRYQALAARGGWPPVPADLKVKPGEAHPGVAALRARLFAEGRIATAAGDTTLDPLLQAAVARFQREHGLPDDGVPGKVTIAELNVPVAERIRTLELNLERWRWLPDRFGPTYVMVNVPTFQLVAVEDGQPALAMRVITGQRATPTPVFSDLIETVVLSPYWNVPRSILRGEVLPELRQDPGYLERKNMEVVRNGERVDLHTVSFDDPGVRVRQRPGAANSLGHVKFLFPNEFGVYLHDTPTDNLFARPARSFSHGCVRLEKPFEFAQWLLRPQPEWTPQRIETAMHSGSEQHVALRRDVPVYIVYRTAWVDDDGSLRFAPDLYGHDQRQAQLVPATPLVVAYAERIAASGGVMAAAGDPLE